MVAIIKRITSKWPEEYKRRLKIGYIYSFFNSVFSAMPVMGAAYGLNIVIQNSRNEREMTKNDIYLILGFMIFTVLGRFITSYLRAITQESIGYEATSDERIKIGDVLKRVSLGFFSNKNAGEIATAVTTDLSFFEMHAMKMIDMVMNGYIYIGVIIISLLFFSIPAALLSIAGISFSALFLKLLGKKSAGNAPMHQKTIDNMASATLEYIRGMAVVKAFKQIGVAREGIEKTYGEGCDINIKIEKNYVPYNCMHLFSLRASSVLIMAAVSAVGAKGGMNMSHMLMMIIFSFVMFGHLERLSDATHVLENLDNTLNKLDNIMSAEFIDIDGRDISLNHYDIEFQNVTFAYEKQDVLKEISFKIKENTTTAIVGPSGSGKSTMCSLIARFYDPDKGAIYVGGVNVREMTCDSLLKNISMVFQKVYLFRDTVINNIRFGRPEASIEEVIEAAKKAQCHDFIMNLPKGYDTIIGDGGATLSGGEKQRISIARAIIKNAPIVILDEATASIDPENEALIQNALGELINGKTIVIIAHRLATIQNADQILVADKGRIVQKGTHKELLSEEGVYSRFVKIREEAEGWTMGK